MKPKILAVRLCGASSILLAWSWTGCQETPDAPDVQTMDALAPALEQPSDYTLAAGTELFDAHCAICHGRFGEGDGPASMFLFPPARDFSIGSFRLASTNNAVPSDDDLVRTLRRGMPGSAMPSWDWMPDEDLRSLAAYVRFLAVDGMASDFQRIAKDEGSPIDDREALDQARRRMTPGAAVELEREPDSGEETLAFGHEVYMRDCAECHGASGTGLPMRASWTETGELDWSRDFTAGILKGGATPEALAHRIRTGMAGTSMPANDLSPRELASVVAYVRSLIPEGADDRLVQRRSTIRARPVASPLPIDPTADAWASAQEVEVVLAPLWWLEESITHASIAALHDGTQIAIRVRWADPTRDDAGHGAYPFGDAAALQFSAAESPPLFGMGSHRDPVNQWHWKAMRIADVAGRLDLVERPPHLSGGSVLDAPLYLPALSASEDVDSRRAAGYEWVRRLAPESLFIQAEPRWVDGTWTVVFVRSATAGAMRDVDLSPGSTVQMACAIWNGSAGDLRGQKSLTIWHELRIEAR